MTYILAQKGGGGGGSDLPVVTPADNGKILGVVSGAWSTVNPDTIIDLPMTLQVGTQESPVYLSELDEGLYAINGKYYILRNSEPFETDYNIIVLVSKEEGLDRAKVKVITADDVTDYDIKENGSSIAVYTNKIVTEKYLSDNHYVIETDLAGYMPKISNPFGGIIVESTSEGTVVETGYNITELNNRIDTAYQTGYSAREEVASKMNQFSSAPAGAGYIVITNGSSQNSVGVATVKAESVLTGYSNHDGFIAVWDKEHGNYITDAGIDASNVATKTFTGSIPQGSSATTIIDYVDEVTTPIKPIPNTPANIVTFGGAAALPMPSLKIGIEPVQSGSGDPSPENIRPISGHTEVKEYNLDNTDKSPFFKGLTNGTFDYIDLGTISWYKSGTSIFYGALSTHKVVEGNTPINAISSNDMIFLQMAGSGNVGYIVINDSNYESYTAAQFKTAMSGAYLIYELATPTTPTITDEQFNSLLTAFGVNGTTYTTALKDGQGNPLTCYGGELSNENGVQSLENTYGELDLGAYNWNYSGVRFVTTGQIADMKAPINNFQVANVMCSIYKTATSSETESDANDAIIGISRYRNICIRDSKKLLAE